MKERYDRADRICDAVARWAATRADIRGLALIGSYARKEARPDSDIDFMFLATDPLALRAGTTWHQAIDWSLCGGTPLIVRDVDYNAAWSRHAEMPDGLEIEFCFGALSWARHDPPDTGTAQVVAKKGCRILRDPDERFARLLSALRSS